MEEQNSTTIFTVPIKYRKYLGAKVFVYDEKTHIGGTFPINKKPFTIDAFRLKLLKDKLANVDKNLGVG